jgi:hypothetical protein
MEITKAWDKLTQNVARRVAAKIPFQEEIFRIDYVLALYQTGLSQERIWAEYPYPKYPKSPSNGVDIFVDAEPGQYMEIKYLRELETGSQRPRTMWLGMLIGDIYKVRHYSADSSMRLLLLIADRTFVGYLKGKGLWPPSEHDLTNIKVGLQEVPDSRETPVTQGLPKTALSKLPDSLLKGGVQYFAFSWTCHGQAQLENLTFCLMEIR